MRQFKKRQKETPEERIEREKRELEKKNYDAYLKKLAQVWQEQ